MNMKNEQGRSMVEMLGVLAVIGVLSVGGISGYTAAMNQYRANEAINRVMRVAVMASSQRLLNPSAVLTDLEDGVAMGNDTNNIVLTISDVPDKVRSRIEAMGFKNATIGSDENGALTFTFNNDLSERSGSSGSTSGGNTQQEPAPEPVDPCNGHGTYNGTTCTCTDNYYGDNCENAPLTCEHGDWDPTYHICYCHGTGYDGNRCQNEVVINKNNFTGNGGSCPGAVHFKYYCKNTNDGGYEGCRNWSCEENGGEYPYYTYEWVSNGIEPFPCDSDMCDFIEE